MDRKGLLIGIGHFAREIIHLISIGKTETLTEVEKHFLDRDIIEYLSKKYDEYFSINFNSSSYDNEALNKYFYDYYGYIQGNESRKYGIENENDGLLLILALITDKVEEASVHWSITD